MIPVKTFTLIAFTALLLTGGCSSSSNVLPTSQSFDVTGRYISTESIQDLGLVTLEINMVFPSRTLRAWMIMSDQLDYEPEGLGTVGDNHMILNFDRGLNSDFYLEGDFETAGDSVTSITGRFIYPDREDFVSVNFEPLT